MERNEMERKGIKKRKGTERKGIKERNGTEREEQERNILAGRRLFALGTFLVTAAGGPDARCKFNLA
jgi:hypothetical protein